MPASYLNDTRLPGGLRTGDQYIAGLKDDGRRVFIDGEEVGDVTSHPAFRDAVRSIAEDPRHLPTSPFTSYNFHGKGNFASLVDAVVLGADPARAGSETSDPVLVASRGGWIGLLQRGPDQGPTGASFEREHELPFGRGRVTWASWSASSRRAS